MAERMEEFYSWLRNRRKLGHNESLSVVSHVKRLIRYNVLLDEDAIRTLLWHESKYMRRNYLYAFRLWKQFVEETNNGNSS